MNLNKTEYQRLKTEDFGRKVLFVMSLWSLVFGLWSGAAFADTKMQFQQANDFYKSGKFNEAAKIYDELAEGSKDHAQLYFNAANSYFRAGKLNEAILNYERALALNPWYSDARYNLNAVRSKIEYKIEDHRNPFIIFHDLALKWFKVSQIAVATLFFSFIFLFSCGLWLRNPNGRHFWAFPRGEFFALFLFFAVILSAKFFYVQHYSEAIVLASEADVRYGPSMDNESLMKMGGGLKVFIVDEREDWSRVVTWNGETGWLKNSELGKVNV